MEKMDDRTKICSHYCTGETMVYSDVQYFLPCYSRLKNRNNKNKKGGKGMDGIYRQAETGKIGIVFTGIVEFVILFMGLGMEI